MTNPTPSRGATGIAWPGLVVLLGSICAYWLSQNELTTSRPEAPSTYQVPSPAGPNAVDAVFSRIWEDPLTAPFERWKNRQPGSLPDHPTPRVIEIIKRRNSESERITKVKAWFADLIDKSNWSETLSLPVLVNGGPYAEDKETRLRTRYAVVTALAHAGYQLDERDQMSYAVVKIQVRVLKDWSQEEFVIPFKLYRNFDTNKQVLVLWVNESQLGVRPLLALHRLTDELFGGVKHREKLTFRIIGPSSSDKLEDICQEINWLAAPENEIEFERLLETFRMCKIEEREFILEDESNSDFSFVNEWFLNPEGPMIDRCKRTVILSPRATVNQKYLNVIHDRSFSESTHFRLVRTIGNDHLLIDHAIKPELKSRGAWPDADNNEVMILLTEQDTSYGVRIVHEFAEVFLRDTSGENGADGEVVIPLRVLKYFCGIDGQTAGNTEQRNVPTESKTDTSGNPYGLPTVHETTLRRPQGESQYDYLRRLKDEIQRLQERQKVTAIGVVASDVYDKLLILRALRPHFPDTVFFTTDLDAIYEHPDELRHTRNLVIASHFGLRLNTDFHDALTTRIDLHPFEEQSDSTPKLMPKSSMLPFRDSYQTAEHLTTRIAIGDEQIRDALKRIVPGQDRSESVLEMASKLWDHDSTKAGDHDHNHEDLLPPLITTVGNEGFRQLEHPWPELLSSISHSHGETSESLPGHDEQGVATLSLQPEADRDARFLRAPLTILLIVLGIVGFLAWDQRRAITEMLGGSSPEGTGRNSSIPPAIQKLQERFLNVVIPIAVVLLIWASIEASFGLERIRLDGTSAMPRVFLQILIGLSAALTLVQFSRRVCGMWEQWSPTFHPRLEDSRVLAYVLDDKTLPRLQPVVVWNTVVFSFYLLILAAVVLYHPPMVTLLLIVGITVLLAAVIWMKFGHHLSKKFGERGPEFFVLFRRSTSQLVFSAFALGTSTLAILMIASAITENYTPSLLISGGWRPYFMSRGGLTTWALDFSSMVFAHATICLLFAAILYSHEWSREFTRYLGKTSRKISHESKAEPHDQVDSLILIGEATVVTTKYTPWLLVYILGLLLAYHPRISPVPIPTGLLIILSLAIGILVASTIYLRRVIQQYRTEVLEDLRGRLFNVRHENEKTKKEKERAAKIRRRWTMLSTISR